MRATFFDEPELEFGGGRHIDIRFGLSTYGALDAGSKLGLASIRLGVVGDQQSIDEFTSWVQKCRTGIERKKSKLSTLFPAFPGFGDGKPICDVVVDPQLTRTISGRDIRSLATLESREQVVHESVVRFLLEADDLYQNSPCNVVICLPPSDLLRPIDTGSETFQGPRSRRRIKNEGEHKTVWHDLLKAKAMGMKGPVQMVRPATYGGKIHRFRQDGSASRDVEDEASRAWNFFTALYYKAGGVPWRMIRRSSDFDACFVGVSYFHEIAGDAVQTTVAQVFNERGEGVVVRGGQALIRKADKTLHMDRETSAALIANALIVYKREHKHFPARVVCHKSSYFDDAEIAGFQEAASSFGIDQLDLLSVRKSSVRFFRNRPNPPLRGTSIELDDQTALLYTQGSVDFYKAYPGLFIPRPLEVRFDAIDGSKDNLLSEILALSKMNWNSTRFVNAEPITIAAARNVGDILRYVTSQTPIQARYSYYM